jgi:hypothetical protein
MRGRCSVSAITKPRTVWESYTATDSEVRALERDFIRATGANNPEVGYNLVPRFKEL